MHRALCLAAHSMINNNLRQSVWWYTRLYNDNSNISNMLNIMNYVVFDECSCSAAFFFQWCFGKPSQGYILEARTHILCKICDTNYMGPYFTKCAVQLYDIVMDSKGEWLIHWTCIWRQYILSNAVYVWYAL